MPTAVSVSDFRRPNRLAREFALSKRMRRKVRIPTSNAIIKRRWGTNLFIELSHWESRIEMLNSDVYSSECLLRWTLFYLEILKILKSSMHVHRRYAEYPDEVSQWSIQWEYHNEGKYPNEDAPRWNKWAHKKCIFNAGERLTQFKIFSSQKFMGTKWTLSQRASRLAIVTELFFKRSDDN